MTDKLLCPGNDCNKNLKLVSNKSIKCSLCDKWYCEKCSMCQKNVFNAITLANSKKEDVSMILYVCPNCKSLTEGIENIGTNINELKTSIEEKISALTDKIITSQNELIMHVDTKSDEITGEIKQEVITQKKSFSEVVKNTTSATLEGKGISNFKIDEVKKIVDQSTVEAKRQEVRDRSFIIFYHEEEKMEDGKQRKENDLKFVEKFVEEGLNITSVNIEECIRLGNFNPDASNPRPLKVTLTSRSEQLKVINNLSNLKQCDNNLYKKVLVRIDRNFQQRKEAQDLLEEAKEKNKGLTDTKWVLRGNPFKPVLKEIKVNKTN